MRPLTPKILTDLFTFLDLSKRVDLCFWATLLVGFFGMLGKSNLMPDSKILFDGMHQLTWGHISFRSGVAVIQVTWAKNIQNRERLLEIPLFPIAGSILCLVATLRLLLAKPGHDSQPLFGSRSKILFTYPQFQKCFKRLLTRAGCQGRDFSTHSMRWGEPVLHIIVGSLSL